MQKLKKKTRTIPSVQTHSCKSFSLVTSGTSVQYSALPDEERDSEEEGSATPLVDRRGGADAEAIGECKVLSSVWPVLLFLLLLF